MVPHWEIMFPRSALCSPLSGAYRKQRARANGVCGLHCVVRMAKPHMRQLTAQREKQVKGISTAHAHPGKENYWRTYPVATRYKQQNGMGCYGVSWLGNASIW